MFLIFHVALPLIFTEIPRIKKLQINRFALVIGSLLPDLIDKPLLLLGLGTGRLFTHNLLFVLMSFLFLHFLTKQNLKISFPFLFGVIMHLILDIPYVPFFYPFISYEFIVIEEPFWYWFRALFTNFVVMITEVTGIILFILILVRNRLYSIKEIISYLKGNHLLPILQLRNEK